VTEMVRPFQVNLDGRLATGGRLHSMTEFANLNIEGLFPKQAEGWTEFLCGLLKLQPDQGLPLHSHSHAETIFVLDGCVQVQRGRAIAELWGPGAAYFPAGVAHSIGAHQSQAASVIVCYPRAKIGKDISTVMEEGADQSGWPNPNIIRGDTPLYRWALVEDYEPWMAVEPTKGWVHKLRYLLDPQRGAPDVVAGVAHFDPHTHYTIHRHEPAEIYYALHGSATIYAGPEAFHVGPGSTVYVPPNVPHGVDTDTGDFKIYWVYGLDACGSDWTWEALEPLYNHPRSAEYGVKG
jgi:quercetin dioxygenase-like cupin family protein